VLLLFGGAAALSIAAVLVLGARGTLVPVLLYLAFGALLTGWLGLRFLRASLSVGLGSPAYLVLFMLSLAICAFATFVSYQGLLVLGDLVSPFDEVDAYVVSFQYHFAGRGPGSLHLFTDAGREYEMLPLSLYGGPRTPGLYRLEVTAHGGLVVDLKPLRD
jgi:hypothetical protein